MQGARAKNLPTTYSQFFTPLVFRARTDNVPRRDEQNGD
jgi:hypothetical protein